MKFLIALLFTLPANAYLLEYDTIMKRVAKNHGSGAYEIQQSIEWKSPDGVLYQVLEDWVVDSESKMKLSIKGQGALGSQVSGEILYSIGKKQFLVENGKTDSKSLPKTFSPIFFHFRSSGLMKSQLTRLGMTGPESLHGRPPFAANKAPTYKEQKFVQLKRVGGAITYGIGTSQASYLYIEQDQFVVTQIEFPSGEKVVAEDYQEFRQGFYYPKTITYHTKSGLFTVRLKRVTSLGSRPNEKVFQRDPKAPPLSLPTEGPFQEFYSLFR